MMKLAGCEGLARRGDEGEASSERDLKAVAARSHRVAVLNFAPKKKKKRSEGPQAPVVQLRANLAGAQSRVFSLACAALDSGQSQQRVAKAPSR